MCDESTIRRATLADAPRLAAVHVAAWRESYAGLVPDAMLSSLSVEGRTAMWGNILREARASASTVVYVAEHDEELVGFGSCGAQRAGELRVKGYDSEISALYVLRAFQRCGVGSRLVNVMATDLSRRRFRAVGLWVLRDNPAGRRFYERYGGHVMSEREEVSEGGALVEVAYGWTDLTVLVRATARSRMFDIRVDDLSGHPARELLAQHLAGMHETSPPGHVFALDLASLRAPNVTVWSAWEGPALAGIAALKELGDGTGELKSMRTHPQHLRKGAAMALLEHIIGEARRRGLRRRRLSLEKSHDLLIWFCGLSSPELHIARVKARVAAGGHPIPEEKIRERYPLAQLNTIKLMPHAAYIQVYDNSAEAAADGTGPDPLLVLEMENGRVILPASDDLKSLQRAPEWTKPILEAAFSGSGHPLCGV